MSKIAPYFPPDPYYKQVWQAVTASDGSIYVRMEDEVRLSVFTTTAGLTITLNGIFVDLEGELKPFEMQLVTAGSGTRESTTRFLGPGFLLYSYPTLSGGTPAIGAVTLALEILQSHNTGGPIVKQLMFGSLTAQGFFPFTVPPQSTQVASGIPKIYSPTSPAAGAEISFTVPAGVLWDFRYFACTFVTSAAVASRHPYFSCSTGTTAILGFDGTAGWTAGTTGRFTYAVSGNNTASRDSGGSVIQIGAVGKVLVPAGAVFASFTSAIDVADQYSGIKIGVVEYPA